VVPRARDGEEQPTPRLRLRQRVEHYLRARTSSALAGAITVGPPSYRLVDVDAVVYAVRIGAVAQVERDVERAVRAFLHPLKGGKERRGFAFGEGVRALELIPVLERVPGVDRVSGLTFGPEPDAAVTTPADSLISVGEVRLEVRSAEEVAP
jgi:hypothetical protein